MKKPTIEDVAKRAGVSKSTVSQYLNERYQYMSENTRRRISEVIEDLKYQPNGLARSLKQNRTFMVGIIVANIDYSLSIKCIRAIENELQQHKTQVIICNADESPEKEREYIEMLAARQVDGLIVFPTGNGNSSYNRVMEMKLPLVFLDRLVDGVSTQSLLLDNEAAVKIAIQEMASRGHKRIAMLSLPLSEYAITPRKERVSGYKKAMEEFGLPIDESFICHAPKDEIAAVLGRLLSLPQPPTALLAGNDIVLAEILKFANQTGLRIPDQLSVIGIDDAEFAHIYNPVITTISQPASDMGTQAARILLSSIEQKGTELPITYRFPPVLQQGQSVQNVHG